MRKIIPTALMAVSLVTLTGVGAAAQDEPPAVAITPAGLNADKIDGRHAVGHGASARKRAGKLVATNKRGQLPSNIVKPAWRLIIGKPAAFRDGQISWGEVQGMPPAFADGVDDMGVTGMKVTKVVGAVDTVLVGGAGTAFAHCPQGSRAVGGGHSADIGLVVTKSSASDDATYWSVSTQNTLDATQDYRAIAQCLAVKPGTAISTAVKR